MSDLFTATHCDRCHKPLSTRLLSRMNLDILCLDCHQEEITHPQYKEACDAELAQVKLGNMNYPGLFADQIYPFKEDKNNGND